MDESFVPPFFKDSHSHNHYHYQQHQQHSDYATTTNNSAAPQQQQQHFYVPKPTNNVMPLPNRPPLASPEPSGASTLDSQAAVLAARASRDNLHYSASGDLALRGSAMPQHRSHHHSSSRRQAAMAGVQKPPVDLFAIPVFLVELGALLALAYAAYWLHVNPREPWLSGFYCDDYSLKHTLVRSPLTSALLASQEERLALLIALLTPIVIIVFCELINSMFGAIKFRRIRALCGCCKLHSITRRTIRFCGAYILGFLIVLISCDLLAASTGHLRPYFEASCPALYSEHCALAVTSGTSEVLDVVNNDESRARVAFPATPAIATAADVTVNPATIIHTNRRPVLLDWPSLRTNDSAPTTLAPTPDAPTTPLMSAASSIEAALPSPAALVMAARQLSLKLQSQQQLYEHKWVDLSHESQASLEQMCGNAQNSTLSSPSTLDVGDLKLALVGKSFPSLPAAIVTYACLFLAVYLSFVGTARPCRILTSLAIVLLMLVAVLTDIELVKLHLHHSQDAIAGATLAAAVVVFVLLVYLNRFKDSHYYKNQKPMFSSFSSSANNSPRAYHYYNNNNNSNNNNHANSNEALNTISSSFNHYDTYGKLIAPNNNNAGSSSANSSPQTLQLNRYSVNGSQHQQASNDIPLRNFQIPRANYRVMQN